MIFLNTINRTLQSILVFSLFLYVNADLNAQKYSNEFLSIGVGAKAQAMGNAVVADVDDVTAGFWNPAGLSRMSREGGFQLSAMHSNWFAGVGKYDYFGFAKPFGEKNRALGLSIIRFGIDDIPNTLSLYEDDGSINYENIVEFSAADWAFLFNYAQAIKVKKGAMQIGGNLKVVHRKIGPFAKSWGFGIDAGVQWQMNKNWHFGFMGKDLSNTFNAWKFNFTEDEKQVLRLTDNEVPISSVEITHPQLILGAAFLKQWKKIGLRTELDFVATTDGRRNALISANPFSINPQIGMELGYGGFVFLRGGINNFQKETDIEGTEFTRLQPNLGVGIKVFKLRIDYAFTDIGASNNTYSHVFSLLLDLNTAYLKKEFEVTY